MDWAKLAELGATGGVAITAILVLRAQARDFASFLGNHMSQITEALNSACERLRAIETRIEDCHRHRDG